MMLWENEAAIRLGSFVGVFVIMAVLELMAPRRELHFSRAARWINNMSITLVYTLGVRFLFPILPVGIAAVAQQRGWGLLNNISIPLWSKIVLGVILLDFIIYLQHVLFHAVPLLWRVHRMHHADPDFDVTTGLRFHPLEIFLSIGIKLAALMFIGAPVVAVISFEVILNSTSMFNHSNVRLPLIVDRIVRLLVVTPDMHRIHHSTLKQETNSNYGFNLPWWDRLMGTYRPDPAAGHEEMTIGLDQFREVEQQSVFWLLALPFLHDSEGSKGDTKRR